MKRKRGQRKLSSDDTIMPGNRAVLPVATRLSNPDGPPATGEEYLLFVRKEAGKFPDILAAEDADKQLRIATVDPAQRPARWRVPVEPATRSTTNQHLLPDKTWRTSFLKTFTRNRQRLQEYRTRAMTEETFGRTYLLPKANDELGWLEFCYGNTIDLDNQDHGEDNNEQTIETEDILDDESIEEETSVELNDELDETAIIANVVDTNEDNQHEQDSTLAPNNNTNNNLEMAKQRLLAALDDMTELSDQITSNTTDSTELKQDTEKRNGVDPALSLVASLSHECTINLLQFHANHFEALSNNPALGPWLYALLLRVDALLTGSEMAVLRAIARNCHTIHNQISDQKDDRLAVLHTIIVIIADYFGQRDMDYE